MDTQMDDLTLYGLEHGTDKAYWHRYTPTYYKYFKNMRDDENVILEIGIGSKNAPSIKMLSNFFKKSKIYTIDIVKSLVDEAGKINNTTSMICDSSNKDELLKAFGNIRFDLIIDDGSHIDSHQKNAFDCLFPLLNPGGIYICEDLHPSGEIHNNNVIMHFNNHASKFKNVEIFQRNENALRCYSCKRPNADNSNACVCGINFLPTTCDSITMIMVKN